MAKFEIKDGVAIIPEGTTEIEVSAYSDEMSWVEAIRKVLVEAGVPMHYKDITRTIKEKKYRLNFGDTPEMTVSNRLTTNPDLFKRVEKGVYGLVETSVTDEMSWVEAIRKVLIEAGEPMHYKDITRTIKEKKYRLNFGDTPEMTVSNRLTTNPDLFKRVEKGVYGLVDTSLTKVDLNVSLRDLVLACIKTIGRKYFEAKELYAFAPIFNVCMSHSTNLEEALKQELDELVREKILDTLSDDYYCVK